MGGSWSSGFVPGDPGGGTGPEPAPPQQPAGCSDARAVARPAPEHYLPDLHHLRLELEEAATPEGHAVRFGFNPLEFENFSWRGYAQMAPIQVGVGCPFPGAAYSAQWGGQASEATGPSCEWREGDPDLPCPPSPGLWPG